MTAVLRVFLIVLVFVCGLLAQDLVTDLAKQSDDVTSSPPAKRSVDALGIMKKRSADPRQFPAMVHALNLDQQSYENAPYIARIVQKQPGNIYPEPPFLVAKRHASPSKRHSMRLHKRSPAEKFNTLLDGLNSTVNQMN
ncbi:uncharacterized protein LOC129725576 [Wyeomyia smithii]|uniref:uncharacterized protein LOC129725576 n=1 Tax=Wyeomyia smithii TaxID=174621 RepID=UPI002467BBDA|nr:uncharacterized protein LOC129725576 [Wyeomyia smithii]